MMNLDFPFQAIWDDHDYGLNDAGIEYPFKQRSKELFLNGNFSPEQANKHLLLRMAALV